MNDRTESAPFYAKPVYRLVSGALGSALLGVGFYALIFTGALTMISAAGGIALVLFGGNMVFSACASRESWLSKIGPLP